MKASLLCPKCDEVILKSMEDGEVKLRTKVLIFRNHRAFAVCKGCSKELEVPVEVSKSMTEVTSRSELKLFIPRKSS